MAKNAETAVPEIIDTVEGLMAKMKAMREAQKVFATYTQEQVDKIFYEAAKAANQQRIPLAKMAVAETGRFPLSGADEIRGPWGILRPGELWDTACLSFR